MTAVLIPLRFGSTRIHLKNFKEFNGKPLYQWVMEEAIGCPDADSIFAATTDLVRSIPQKKRELLSIVREFKRSHQSETDNAPLEILLEEFTKEVPYDKLIVVQCTNPFISSEDITKAIRLLDVHDSIVSVCRQKKFIYGRLLERPRPRTQDMEGYLVENGAIYGTTRKQFLESKFRLGGNMGFLEMPPHTYYEIDDEYDWEICRNLHLKYLTTPLIPATS